MKALEEKILIGLGVWLAVLPFTGVPRSWKNALISITGLVVVYLAALLWRKTRTRHAHAGHMHGGADTTTQPSL